MEGTKAKPRESKPPKRIHTLSKWYLKGFIKPGETKLWRYSKSGAQTVGGPPVAFAAINDYWSPEAEMEITKTVERPGGRAQKKFIAGEELTPQERIDFSHYIYSFYRRVPKGKEQIEDLLPEAWQRSHEAALADLQRRKLSEPLRAEALDLLIAELKAHPQPLTNEIRAQMFEFMQTREAGEPTAEVIANMEWTLVRAGKRQSFVTTDCPLCITEIGIGPADGQLLLPLDQNHALLATWWRYSADGVLNADEKLMGHLNRSVVKMAQEYIYSPTRRNWIETYLKNESKREKESHQA